MEWPDKINAVSSVQEYIKAHYEEDISLEDLSRAAHYSKYHIVRIFKELTGRTPFEEIRALRLTKAAARLRDDKGKVIDAALDSGFDSSEGFTRAFARQFGITPQKYSRETPAVNYFIQYPVKAGYILRERKNHMSKEIIERTMTVTAAERPERKLILVRSVKAADYFSFCAEMGCGWEGLFNSIPEKFDKAALLTLPPNLIKAGTGNTAAGVEVPYDYNKPIPEGCDIIELPPCIMLYFQGSPFKDENDFGEGIGVLWEIMESYDPIRYGWEYAPELAPYFNFGASAKEGAKMARPVRRI